MKVVERGRGVSRSRVTYFHWGGGVLQIWMQVHCFPHHPRASHTHSDTFTIPTGAETCSFHWCWWQKMSKWQAETETKIVLYFALWEAWRFIIWVITFMDYSLLQYFTFSFLNSSWMFCEYKGGVNLNLIVDTSGLQYSVSHCWYNVETFWLIQKGGVEKRNNLGYFTIFEYFQPICFLFLSGLFSFCC